MSEEKGPEPPKRQKAFDLLASVAVFARKNGIALNDSALVDRFMADAEPRLREALADPLIHGSRVERLFEATVLSLGRFKLLKTEDVGQLTDPKDRKLAQVLLFYGEWEVKGPIPFMDGDQIGGVELVVYPVEPTYHNQGWEGSAWRSGSSVASSPARQLMATKSSNSTANRRRIGLPLFRLGTSKIASCRFFSAVSSLRPRLSSFPPSVVDERRGPFLKGAKSNPDALPKKLHRSAHWRE
ncbi:hypothetical protein AB3G45_05995 [Shinella sp. S4-D37]|uniref:hypothetical protein n=1 Tax=Shinella sp. S4-D37 TaxID=3161999 RepID=UPI0034664E56